MEKFLRSIETFGKQAVRSVAFLPVPMIFVSLVLAFIFFSLEQNTEISAWVEETFPQLNITSQDTARTILGMFIGGLITLTVFTFSQIMILLNQVAANYSPRLLSKLTGDRALQFVMGLNLATIVLTIGVLISIRSSDDYRIPNFSILVCTILGISCLCLFVYFVTAITKKIQVGQIIFDTSRDALDGLDYEESRSSNGYEERSLPREVAGWYAIPSPIGGYVGTLNLDSLSRLAGEFGTRFFIGINRGQYVPKGLPIMQSEVLLTEEQVQRCLSAVAPIHAQFDDWFLPNLKQLTEIALKAMSPGINDPGTALTVIDRQTEILSRMMDVPLYNYYCYHEEDSDSGGEVWFSRHDYDEVVRTLMQEMRTYSRQDPLVTRRLIQMVYHLLMIGGDSISYRVVLEKELRALIEDARRFILNGYDRATIAADIRHHRKQLKHLRRLQILERS